MDGAQLLGGRYALLEEVGAGGMAVVWRARDEVLGRPVAVKLLAGRHAGEPDARDRIRAEARAAATLSHPNIAQVYDYGESNQVPYVVMELIRGGTLQDRMDAGPMSPRFAMRVAAEVAAALAAAHADGLVHRDIKPANVMVTETGAKVVDFGIAAAVDPAGTGDEDFEVLGTPAYLAPERLTGDGVEPASDVYALGVLLYRMLSGHSPWSADTTTQMLSAHVYIDPEPLPRHPGVPEFVTALCNRCLTKDPTQRPSAREAAALLAQGAGLRVVEDAPPVEPAGASYDREPSVLIRPRSAGLVPPPVGPPATAVAGPDPVAPGVFAASGPAAASLSAASAPAGPVTPDSGKARRRKLILPVAVVVVLLALAGLLWWQLGTDDDRGTSPTAAPPGPGAAPASAAPSASTSVAGRRATTAPSDRTPALPGNTRPAPAGQPGATAAGPGIAPPPAGVPAPTTTQAPEPEEPAPTRTTQPVPQERTLTSAGGSVRATCPSASTAQLLSWSATKPYKVNDVDEGPAASTVAEFKHGNRLVTMTVTCSGGVPSSSTDDS